LIRLHVTVLAKIAATTKIKDDPHKTKGRGEEEEEEEEEEGKEREQEVLLYTSETHRQSPPGVSKQSMQHVRDWCDDAGSGDVGA
jgi:hypothetical protein